MFKVICKIQKVATPHRVIITRQDCRPCEFSDYQMFDDNNNLKTRAVIAELAVNILEMSALDISKSEYQNLANKLYYLDDLTDYRYIGLFDENAEVKNVNNLGLPWIYSSIIRHITQDYTSMLINNAWDYATSWLWNSQQYVQDEKENFKTIWEKQYLFSLPPTVNTHRLKGTIIKDDYKDGTGNQYYAIDTFFLMHLLSSKQNSQCTPLSDRKLMISSSENFKCSISDTIYDEFKTNLPKLFGLKYLDTLNNMRDCTYFADDGLTPKSNQILKGVSEKYTLDLVSNTKQQFHSIQYIEICQKLGGTLMPIVLVVNKTKERCSEWVKAHSKLATDGLLEDHIGTNELYHFNCLTLNEAVSAVGNIEDLYIY